MRFGLPDQINKGFATFYSANLNLKPRFEFKSNKFSNSNKSRYFPKIEI
jgi:hypothetical protein